MQKWEYVSIEIKYNGNRVDYIESNGKEVLGKVLRADSYDYLNKLGKEGWEMVGAGISSNETHGYYFFKRPIE